MESLILRKITVPLRFRLLLYILPIICIPVAIVSYLSYSNSVHTFTILSKDKLVLEAQKSGDNTESVFASAFIDVDTIWSIFAGDFENYQSEGFFYIHKDNVSSILNKFMLRSPYYFQVGFFDIDGTPIVSSYERHNFELIDWSVRRYLIESAPDSLITISDLIYSPLRQGYLITISKVIFDENEQPCTALMLDLDYNRLMTDMVGDVEKSGAQVFIADKLGRVLYHPEYEPYGFNLLTQQEPTVRNFLVEMLVGNSGWDVFEDGGLQVAAYAPVKTPGWSVALSLSFKEFGRDSENLRRKTLSIMFITIVFAVSALFVIASTITRPIGRLVRATRKIQAGNFNLSVRQSRTRDEVGLLTSAFNEMVISLNDTHKKLVMSEKLASMGRFSSGIAHEIRNPLHAMHGAATYLKRRRKDDGLVMEYADMVIHGIDRLNAVVTDFLHFAKESRLHYSKTDIRLHLRVIIREFVFKAHDKGIEIEDHLGPFTPVYVNLDPDQMARVFNNIITNAIQAMPQGGCLEIKLKFAVDKIKISFADNGCGIKSEHLSNIYDPFFTTKEDGVGLGLPIIIGIVESHKGHVDIQSTEGAGTTVTIVLPLEHFNFEKS